MDDIRPSYIFTPVAIDIRRADLRRIEGTNDFEYYYPPKREETK